MASNQSKTFGTVTGIPSERSGSSITGWIIFGLGAVYMLLMGWLSSWWVVPTIRQAGLDDLPGMAFFFLWQFSAPVGALMVVVGAAFIARVEASWKGVLIAGSLVVVAWLYISMVVVKEVMPPVFGIGGGLISLAFLGASWDWARSRPGLSGSARTGLDLGMFGHVFYLIAAWYLCGLLGAPTFLLRPEKAMTIIPESNAISLGTTILICMALGSVFTFARQRVSLRGDG